MLLNKYGGNMSQNMLYLYKKRMKRLPLSKKKRHIRTRVLIVFTLVVVVVKNLGGEIHGGATHINVLCWN